VHSHSLTLLQQNENNFFDSQKLWLAIGPVTAHFHSTAKPVLSEKTFDCVGKFAGLTLKTA
jgi:hypothetical protein